MKTSLAILFLVAGSLLAQPVFPLLITPKKASAGGGGGSGDALLPSGLAFRLKSSDLIVGQNVSNWTDQIHGVIYTNVDSSTWPTNSAKGVWFNIGSFLQSSSGFAFDSSQQVLVIFNEHGASANGAIAGNTGGVKYIGSNSVSHGFGFDNILWSGPLAMDLPCDAMTTGNVFAYTNGIEAIGSGIDSFTFNVLGVDSTPHTDKYSGYLAELDIWTNASVFNATQRSNIHYYSTNFSALSPYSP